MHVNNINVNDSRAWHQETMSRFLHALGALLLMLFPKKEIHASTLQQHNEYSSSAITTHDIT